MQWNCARLHILPSLSTVSVVAEQFNSRIIVSATISELKITGGLMKLFSLFVSSAVPQAAHSNRQLSGPDDVPPDVAFTCDQFAVYCDDIDRLHVSPTHIFAGQQWFSSAFCACCKLAI